MLLSDINAQRKKAGATETNTVYNKRTAQAQATQIDANANTSHLQEQQQLIQQQRADLVQQEAAGTVDAAEAARQHTLLTNAAQRVAAGLKVNGTNAAEAGQHLDAANTAYGSQAAGFQSSYDTASGNTSIAGGGVIQQSAINNIKKQHPEWSDAQVMQQINDQTPGIQSTMAESGKGMLYDDKGVAVPGSEGRMKPTTSLRNNPTAQSTQDAAAKTEADINGILIKKTIQIGTSKDGTPIYGESIDEAATAAAKQAARTAAKQKAAADANYAASRTEADAKNMNPGSAGAGTTTPATTGGEDDTPPPPNPDSFLAGLDALEKQYAGTSMAPMFEFYKGQYADLAARGLRGEQLLSAIQARTDKYVATQQASSASMEKAWTAMYDKIQSSQLDSAQRTYDQQSRLAAQQKQRDQQEYERAIRDQQIKNEEDRQSLLMGNGISGGWRSAMHTSKMISAFKKAENIVSDLQNDKINNSTAWDNKMIDIEQTLHANITAAYDAHNVNLLTLQDKLDARASEIDKTVFNSDISQMQMIDKLTNDWFDGVASIAKDTTNTVTQINKDTLAAAKEARTELTQQKTDFRSRYQFHISTFGDLDPAGYAQLVAEARELGVNIPSSAPTTLEQKSLAMKEMETGISNSQRFTPNLVNGVDLSSIARTVVGRLPDTRQSAVERDLFNSISTGNMNEFMNKAVTNGLEGLSVTTQNDYKDAVKGLSYTADAAKYLPGLEGTNVYKRVVGQNINTALGQNKDEPWLLALAKFQIVSTKIVQDLSGKQVTDGEARRLSNILTSRGDTVGDIATKLKAANDYFQTSYDSTATLALGLGYGAAVKNGQIVNFNATQKNQGANDDYQDDPSLNQGGFRGSGASGTWGTPKETSMSGVMNSLLGIQTATAKDFSPSVVADTLTQKQGVSDWVKSLGGRETAGYDSGHVKIALSDNGLHGGLDIGVPVGTPVKPLVGGKVVSISGSPKDKKGYGLSVTIEDNAGVFHKYSHLSSIPSYIQEALDNGENPLISPENVFAYSGNSGKSTGPHIDYRARKADGKWIRVEDTYAMAPSQKTIASTKQKTNA